MVLKLNRRRRRVLNPRDLPSLEAGLNEMNLRIPRTKPVIIKDELEQELKPVLVVVRAIGLLPIYKTASGWYEFSIFSRAMACSVLEFIAILLAVSYVHYDEVNGLSRKSYDEAMQVLLNLLFDLLVVVLPFFYYMEANRMANYFNNWKKFQIQYFRVTGQSLNLSLKRRAYVITIFTICWSIFIEAVYGSQSKGPFKKTEFLTSIYQDLLRNFLCIGWHLICAALIRISQNMVESFKKEAESSFCSARVISDYRLLWLSLSRLAQETGQAMCYTYGFYISYLFLTLLLSVYETVTAIKTIATDSVALVEGIIIATCLFVVCDAASRVGHDVGTRWQLILATSHSTRVELQMQLDDFLQTCSLDPPVMTLGDYIVVDRSMLMSTSSTMLTYLVVLLQFELSAVTVETQPAVQDNATTTLEELVWPD